MRVAPASLGFVLLLAGIAALPPVSIDMCLPALAAIGADLAAPPPRVGRMVRALAPRSLAVGHAGVLGHRASLGPCLIAALSFAGPPCVFPSGLRRHRAGADGGRAAPRPAGAPGRCGGADRVGGVAALPAQHGVSLALASAGRFSVGAALPLLVLAKAGIGLVVPNAVQGAPEPHPGMAAVAAALRARLQMPAAGIASAAVAALSRGTPVAISLGMAACSAAARLVWTVLLRPGGRTARSPVLAASGADT